MVSLGEKTYIKD